MQCQSFKCRGKYSLVKEGAASAQEANGSFICGAIGIDIATVCAELTIRPGVPELVQGSFSRGCTLEMSLKWFG